MKTSLRPMKELSANIIKADESSQSQVISSRNIVDSQLANTSSSKRLQRFHPEGETEESILGPKFYIETNLDLLQSLSVSITKSGTKLRHEKADSALDAVENRYSALWENLKVLLLIGPYEQALISSVTAMEFNQHIFSPVAIVIRAWLRDPSRLTSKQIDMMRAVIIRHNRILYVRDPDDFKSPGKSKVHGASEQSPRTTKQIFAVKDSIGGASRQYLIPEAEEVAQTTNLSSHQDVTSQVLPSRSSRYPRSVAGQTYSQTATEIGSSFKAPFQTSMPLSDQHVEAFQAVTDITRIGLVQEYPSRPQKERGDCFKCPYCSKFQPGECLESKSRWG